MTLHALLVGIDVYGARRTLQGSVRDVRAVQDLLRERFSGCEPLVLCDGDATLAAVRDALTGHLGRARRGDRALFWFSGHGSEMEVPAGSGYWRVEPSGALQTLVCADSRDYRDGAPVGDLLDKELARLLDGLTARGVDMTVVLDCCHSAGATRGEGIRGLAPAPPVPAPVPQAPEDPDPDRDPGPPGSRVVLAACRIDEKARELQVGARAWHGVFTHALLACLRAADPSTTARDLLAAVRIRMRDAGQSQTPVLLPATPGPADRAFLGGAARRPGRLTARAASGSWEVDAGAAHGVPEPAPGREVLFRTVERPGRELRAVATGPGTTVVEPVGPPPDPSRAHPVRLVGPMPLRCPVRFGATGDDAGSDVGPALDLVRQAIAAAGPDGRGSGRLDPDGLGRSTGPPLRVVAPVRAAGPVFGIRHADGTPACDDELGHTPGAARTVVGHLEHIARWHALRTLANPTSALGDPIRIDVLPAGPGEDRIPEGPGRPLRPDAHGDLVLQHPRHGDPPRIFVRLRNRGDRALWCVLVHLNDRYGASTELFEGHVVGAGRVGPAVGGLALSVSFPPGRAPVPGASVRDLLLAVVSEVPLNTLPFELPALRAPVHRTAGGPFQRIDDADWTTTIVSLLTRGPD